MIMERIYDLALPRLSGKRIKEVRIGISLMVVELDDGSIGVTYVLRDEIDHVCSAIPQDTKIVGMPAEEVAKWALQHDNVISSALGLAVLNAVAPFEQIEAEHNQQGITDTHNDFDAVFSVEIQPEDTIGVIGHIGPVIMRLTGKVKRMIVFERGEKIAPPDFPESKQPELLPQCQVVFVTSASLINGTLENLLKYCQNARDIVMVGSSTPMYPLAFSGTKVTVLAGTKWLSEYREGILTDISLCAGIKQMMKYGQKVTAKIEK